MVPVVDLARRGQRFSGFAASVERVLASGRFLLGDELRQFEDAWARFTGAEHAIGVSSGAAAIQLGLEAMGIGRGDEVVVPAFTAVPTASAVIATGATPVFADVDAATACLDPEAAVAAVTDRTAAVIVVHLYGYPSEIPGLNVPVVEDAAQAHGALDDVGRSALTAYSFYPTKNLGGVGDGGAIVTNSRALAAEVTLRRVHGMREQYVHEVISQNHRMSELEAAWLREGLEFLDEDTARRRQIAAAYREAAPQLRWQRSHARHAYHLCVVRHGEREEFRRALAEAGVGTAVHYPLALGEQPAYTGYASIDCPEAAGWARECVTLPCFPEMTDAEVELVARALSRLS